MTETPTIVCLDRQMGHITPQVVQEVRKGCMTSVATGIDAVWLPCGQQVEELWEDIEGEEECGGSFFFEVRGMESGGDNRPTWIPVKGLDRLVVGNKRDHV